MPSLPKGERLRLARERHGCVEIPAADQLGIGDVLARMAKRLHDAVRCHEVA